MRILDAKIPTEPEIGLIFLKLNFAIRDTRNLTSANYSKTFRNNSIDLRPTNVSSTGSPGPFSCRLTLKGLVKSSISIFQTWEVTGIFSAVRIALTFSSKQAKDNEELCA